MNQIIVPTGYIGSGSSAFTDLVSEIEGYEKNQGSYEYIFLHCPNGLFDMEDKLLSGNTAVRSDEAIHSFLACMHRLQYNRNYWFSNYGKKLTPRFYEFCERLVEDLHPVAMKDVCWYYQENNEEFFKRIEWNINVRMSRLLKRPFPKNRPTTPLDYTDIRMAFPSPETFYAAAKKFLAALYCEAGIESHHLVMDQLLLPHNLFRIDNYFDDNLRVFVSARDPRDVFLLNKYVWYPTHQVVPMPLDAEDFCTYYAAMRESEKMIDDPRILRLHFEDLIYRYDESCLKIYDFLGVTEMQHASRRKSVFKPEVSAGNTRLFLRGDYPAEEIAVIEKRLPQYLYDFPEDVPLPEVGNSMF